VVEKAGVGESADAVWRDLKKTREDPAAPVVGDPESEEFPVLAAFSMTAGRQLEPTPRRAARGPARQYAWRQGPLAA